MKELSCIKAIKKHPNLSFCILGYIIWFFPCLGGCCGLHWTITLFRNRKLSKHQNKIIYHHLTRIFLISFFNFLFWFTRIFICDYRFVVSDGIINWENSFSNSTFYNKTICTNGKSHPKPGQCFSGIVSNLLFLHLGAMMIWIGLWVFDGLTYWVFERWLNKLDKAEEKEKKDEKKGMMMKICMYGCSMVVVGIVASAFGLVFSWLLMFGIGRLLTGFIQGMIAIGITVGFIIISWILYFVIITGCVIIRKKKMNSIIEDEKSNKNVEDYDSVDKKVDDPVKKEEEEEDVVKEENKDKESVEDVETND